MDDKLKEIEKILEDTRREIFSSKKPIKTIMSQAFIKIDAVIKQARGDDDRVQGV